MLNVVVRWIMVCLHHSFFQQQVEWAVRQQLSTGDWQMESRTGSKNNTQSSWDGFAAVSFAILRSAILCIRGSSLSCYHPVHESNISLTASEGRVSSIIQWVFIFKICYINLLRVCIFTLHLYYFIRDSSLVSCCSRWCCRCQKSNIQLDSIMTETDEPATK